MNSIFVTAFLAGCATYLGFPFRHIAHWSLHNPIRRKPKLSDELILNFFVVFRLELESGEIPLVALERALAVVPKSLFVATRIAIEQGTDVVEGLQHDSRQVPIFSDMCLAMQLSHQQGAQLGDALYVMTKSIQERIATNHLMRSELASVKATIGVLAFLPVIGLGFGSMLNAHPISWLTSSNLGRLCFAFALGLEVLGLVWTRKLMTRAIREAH